MFSLRRQDSKASERKSGGRGPERRYASAPPVLAVQRASCACGGGCPRCRNEYPLQAKLEVSQPGDNLEQEAGRFAGQVMRTPGPQVQRHAMEDREEQQMTSARLQTDGGETENRTGIPHPLRAGLEALSGLDLSGIRVHTNSAKPDQLDAFAFTQGQAIHVGPGQEKHLPHEGWHAVQQMQGRVQPTMRAEGEPVNDDAYLEREADVMGTKALQTTASDQDGGETHAPPRIAPAAHGTRPAIQRAMKFEFQTGNYVWKINKAGTKVEPLPRKYGASKDPEGGENAFLTTGVEGDPAVKVGDMVKAKGIDKKKPAEFILTYRVIDEGKRTVELVERKKTKEKAFNPDTYEIRYVDAKGTLLNVHRDARGHFEDGPGDIMKKATEAKEGSAIELQSENEGFIEFETPKWFRKWSALKKRVQEAVDMTTAMSAAPLVTDEAIKDAVKSKVDSLILDSKSRREKPMGKLHEWPDRLEAGHLPIVKEGGRLLVEILDYSWPAAIQSSESIALTQFESLLEEHHPSALKHTVAHADEIVKAAAGSGKTSSAGLENLRSFLQLIFYYIERGRREDIREKKKDKSLGPPGPSKYAFWLMSRTSFSSMYASLLNEEQRELFQYIVKEKLILKELMKNEEEKAELGNLEEDGKFFRWGHGGSKDYGPTIDKWLKSIVDPVKYGRKVKNKKGKKVDRDLLSNPLYGSAAMGAFDVDTEPGEDDTKLVRFEIRNTKAHMGGREQPASKWVEYAEEVFKSAAEKRKRPESVDDPATAEDETAKTALIYDEPVPSADFEVVPKLNLRLDDRKVGVDVELRTFLPTLLDGKLRPFVYAGVGTGGLSAGAGATAEPFTDMSLFLTGKGGVRTDWFKSIEVGGGLEAGWAFGENRSLRLGVGWEVWQRLDADEKRTHLLNLFVGKSF